MKHWSFAVYVAKLLGVGQKCTIPHSSCLILVYSMYSMYIIVIICNAEAV